MGGRGGMFLIPNHTKGEMGNLNFPEYLFLTDRRPYHGMGRRGKIGGEGGAAAPRSYIGFNAKTTESSLFSVSCRGLRFLESIFMIVHTCWV